MGIADARLELVEILPGNAELTAVALEHEAEELDSVGAAKLLSSFQELPPDLRPLRPEDLRELVQRDAVAAGGSTVRQDVLPSRFETGPVGNPFHQVF
jgi:hypothetical protein